MLLLRLRPDDNDEELVTRLANAGIETQSLSSHYAGKTCEQGLLLSFAGFTEKELRAAAKKLVGEGLQSLRKRTASIPATASL